MTEEEREHEAAIKAWLGTKDKETQDSWSDLTTSQKKADAEYKDNVSASTDEIAEKRERAENRKERNSYDAEQREQIDADRRARKKWLRDRDAEE